jgi:putative phosphoribosyl transferase
VFEDRIQAGNLLADNLLKYRKKDDLVVLGIPRGGVPVAKVIADKLKAPLDVLVVRKIGAPGHEELALGAIGPEAVSTYDNELIKRLNVDESYLKRREEEEKKEIGKRLKRFGKKKGKLNLKGKSVILVDDGVATGSTVEAAVKYLRANKVGKIILAVPVAPRSSMEKLERIVDETVVLSTPKGFMAVGQFYDNFPQVDDEEVKILLTEK